MKRIFSIIIFLLPFLLSAQTYIPSFVNPQVVNGKFQVTIAVAASAGNTFQLGDANFKYNYVRNALENGVVISQTPAFSSRYTLTTTGTGTTIGRQHLNVVALNYSNVLTITDTPTELFTVQYDIVNAASFPTVTLNWRITSPATNINSSPYATNGTTGNLTTLSMVTSPTSTKHLAASSNSINSLFINISPPVVLTNFSARTAGKVNELIWESNAETNLRAYEVERSIDRLSFKSISGVVEPNATKRYAQFDNSPMSLSYYRLKMVDFDGSAKYSEILQIARKDITASIVNVSPNPTRAESWVEYNSERKGEVSLQIIDTHGRVLQSLTQSVEQGYNKMTIDLSSYAQGTYFITVNDGKKSSQRTIVKQ